MRKRYKILNKDRKKKINCFRILDQETGKIVGKAMTIDAIHSKWQKLEQELMSKKKEQ